MTPPRDPNIYDPCDEARELPSGFAATRSRVGDAAGSDRLGASMWQLEPGQAAYPLHFHYCEEELLVVIDGEPLLRQSDTWRRLERGAVVSFLPGPDGAHQLLNDGDQPVRFLAISTSGAPDIVGYPEEDKIGVAERPPGDGKLWAFFRTADAVSYNDGLVPPELPPTAP